MNGKTLESPSLIKSQRYRGAGGPGICVITCPVTRNRGSFSLQRCLTAFLQDGNRLVLANSWRARADFSRGDAGCPTNSKKTFITSARHFFAERKMKFGLTSNRACQAAFPP